jgi:hypothetical protein
MTLGATLAEALATFAACRGMLASCLVVMMDAPTTWWLHVSIVMRGALVGRRVEPQHQARLTAICSSGINENNVDARVPKEEQRCTYDQSYC